MTPFIWTYSSLTYKLKIGTFYGTVSRFSEIFKENRYRGFLYCGSVRTVFFDEEIAGAKKKIKSEILKQVKELESLITYSKTQES